MKYVKSISLFFVYSLCCFIFGLLTGTLMQGRETSEMIVKESQTPAEEMNHIIPDNSYGRESAEIDIEPENESSEQYVMNSNAIPQFPEIEQTVSESGYYIALLNDCVVVYHSDRQTVFLSTDIHAEELPVDVKVDLENGIYMTDEGMLYDFLESYTS